MLRSLVLILLLVNAAFFAWRHGWLNELVGVRPDGQREPQRLSAQINPDKIVVPPLPEPADASQASAEAPSEDQTGEEAAEAAASAPSPAEPAQDGAPAAQVATAASAAKPGKAICVEAGPFSAAEYATAEAALRPVLPAGLWTKQIVNLPGMWLVYMGPYNEAEQLQRKQEELKRIKDLDFEVVRTPANLAPGISLGRFSKRENADNQLEILRSRGIRTARIVNLRPPQEQQLLRIARADVDTQVRLSGIKLPQGKGFTACRRG